LYVYANIECAGYPIENIDTIAADGSIDRNSALHLAVYGDTDDHLKLLDGFMINLLFKKWHGYVKYKYTHTLALSNILYCFDSYFLFYKCLDFILS